MKLLIGRLILGCITAVLVVAEGSVADNTEEPTTAIPMPNGSVDETTLSLSLKNLKGLSKSDGEKISEKQIVVINPSSNKDHVHDYDHDHYHDHDHHHDHHHPPPPPKQPPPPHHHHHDHYPPPTLPQKQPPPPHHHHHDHYPPPTLPQKQPPPPHHHHHDHYQPPTPPPHHHHDYYPPLPPTPTQTPPHHHHYPPHYPGYYPPHQYPLQYPPHYPMPPYVHGVPPMYGPVPSPHNYYSQPNYYAQPMKQPASMPMNPNPSSSGLNLPKPTDLINQGTEYLWNLFGKLGTVDIAGHDNRLHEVVLINAKQAPSTLGPTTTMQLMTPPNWLYKGNNIPIPDCNNKKENQ